MILPRLRKSRGRCVCGCRRWPILVVSTPEGAPSRPGRRKSSRGGNTSESSSSNSNKRFNSFRIYEVKWFRSHLYAPKRRFVFRSFLRYVAIYRTFSIRSVSGVAVTPAQLFAASDGRKWNNPESNRRSHMSVPIGGRLCLHVSFPRELQGIACGRVTQSALDRTPFNDKIKLSILDNSCVSLGV